MWYNVVVNDWGETTYVPTALGNGLLAAVIVALLGVAAVFARLRMRKAESAKAGPAAGDMPKGSLSAGGSGVMTAKRLVFCAMAVALGTVLSRIKLFHFPTGGSVTLLSMLVICLPGYFFGLGAGLMTGLAYGVLELLIDPYILFPMQLVLDYLLAFGALGLSGVFSNAKNGLVKGYLLAVLGRYVFVVISGWVFFGAYAWEGWAPLPYSLVYNAIYIFAEAAVSVIVIRRPQVRSAVARVRKMVAE